MDGSRRIARFAEGERVFYALLEGDDGLRELPGGPFGAIDPGRIRSRAGLSDTPSPRSRFSS